MTLYTSQRYLGFNVVYVIDTPTHTRTHTCTQMSDAATRRYMRYKYTLLR